MHVGLWLFILSGTWWLWSGKTDTLIVIFGVVSVLGTLLLFLRMDRYSGGRYRYALGIRPLAYLPGSPGNHQSKRRHHQDYM